ncbi:related to 3-phytase precursor [Fusarium fujikuroi IMI 58289]|uniref:Related to 3-phytase n=1 Tax=Gibberella fujikuroi (strain CBS 195.34 / IMI 58289 / NRRL A-6831) TaxID=1279085 RepID=S0DMC6_GIBF5|nr:related to 3-phytase precursor [Fusarium fujikuroi IMI 58289]CCT63779.1 related to 3-phytase precursor [Fusarium fujikuroi IMI 58289]SCN98702.1 related to 3-phytase precursor [Fusarium fujikuroi]
MVGSSLVGLLAVVFQICFVKAVDVDVAVSAYTSEVESDWTAVYYSDRNPLLIGNDGGPDKGGFHVYDLNSKAPLKEVAAKTPGRSKLVTTVYDVNKKDIIVTIAQPDSIVRAYEMPKFKQIRDADFKVLGDWSALCSWKSPAGNDYVFLFGKGQAVQLLLQETKKSFEFVQIQTFPTDFETSGCAVSRSESRMYISTDDDKSVYAFSLKESTKVPKITKVGKAEDDVTGLAVYVPKKGSDYLFVAQTDKIAVYDSSFKLKGTLSLTGQEDIEVQGLNIYQGATSKYPAGALTYAIESEDVNGFAVSSLENALKKLKIEANTKYDPRKVKTDTKTEPICKTCGGNGYCIKDKKNKCECFAGFAGSTCSSFTCTDKCSGHGKCAGPNECKCDKGWGGLHCSFLLIEPTYETESRLGDGDDPAIWISPDGPEKSRIVTTMKSGKEAGLGVFDLAGNLLQSFTAGEPNNVDMIYGFKAGNRKVDLAFAACRADDTLCLFEMLPNGTLTNIAGGIHPVVDDYKVYGSCTYKSPKSGKQYLFVNEKSARYLQYELTSTSKGELQTKLVREFQGGSGGQVEGCVSDEENGWIFLGEEPSALWRYDAEPDSKDKGVVIGKIGDGKLYGDVEGVTLVYGSKPTEGFILVSCQGVSAYNVYRRAAPHEYVTTFTLVESSDGQIDPVSNTDGITAVGTALNKDFPHGLVVVHDDANQLPNGKTSAEASFKLVSLEKILGSKVLGKKGLLDQVDKNWDPRK